jgi:hypothetical protein
MKSYTVSMENMKNGNSKAITVSASSMTEAMASAELKNRGWASTEAQVVTEMKTGTDKLDILIGIGAVIQAAGWDAMAQQFIDEPEYRVRIVNGFTNILNKKDSVAAQNFRRLAATVVEGVSAA